MLRRNRDYLMKRMQSAMSAGFRVVGGETTAEAYAPRRPHARGASGRIAGARRRTGVVRAS